MRYSQAEKMEIIRTVEESALSANQTLKEMDINRSSFYEWYRRYEQSGYDGLTVKKPHPRRFWNKIPETETEQIVSVALERPEDSPRQLACHIADTQSHYTTDKET